MSEGPVARVASVVVDCENVDTLVDFWTAVLGLEVSQRFPGFVWLGRMGDGGPMLAFQQVPEKKATKNRLHLDLAVPDREAAIARVEALGATRLADHQIGGFHWTVMADPEGNEFCIAPEH